MSPFPIRRTNYTQYLLDTNVMRELYHRNEIVLKNYNRVHEDCIWIPIVAYVEEVRGWANEIGSQNTDEKKARGLYELFLGYRELMDKHQIFPYTSEAMVRCATLDKLVQARDRRIAACALAHNFKVVTSNTRHFEKLLPSDRCVDWKIDPELR